jgi:hypothetical protein
MRSACAISMRVGLYQQTRMLDLCAEVLWIRVARAALESSRRRICHEDFPEQHR